jgi:KDO2-lipid IV(A) lauroyltransferase
MRRLRFAVEAAAFAALMGAARVVPRRALLALGALGGRLGYFLDARHRRIGLQNLRLAYGDELDDAGARRILRACWRHFGRITLDTLAFPRLGREAAGRLVRYEGLEHLQAAYAEGRGVLFFTGHFGHWELTALMQGFLGKPLAVVARPLDNPRLEVMLARLRGGSGNRIIHKRNAVREMLRTLQNGGGVAIVIDQDARDAGLFVPFFGRPASTTPTLATLALRTRVPVVPAFSVPEPGGRYRIVYERPVTPPDTGDRQRDVLELTARCTAVVERWVRRRPEVWLWMHRRWKTTPPAEAEQR